MNKLIAGLAGMLSLGLVATAAEAAPLGTAGKAAGTAISSEVIQVHGIHSSCRRDRYGWHRSYVWGRQRCAPSWMKHQHRHHKHYKHHRRWKKR